MFPFLVKLCTEFSYLGQQTYNALVLVLKTSVLNIKSLFLCLLDVKYYNKHLYKTAIHSVLG